MVGDGGSASPSDPGTYSLQGSRGESFRCFSLSVSKLREGSLKFCEIPTLMKEIELIAIGFGSQKHW